MGLKVHSLARLPSADRDYFVHLLDYGWEDPLSETLRRSFHRMADVASRNGAVVISGFDGQEFTSEVFSWHKINGQPGEEILPAILITTCHPQRFAESNEFPHRSSGRGHALFSDRMVLVPLREVCRTETDVAEIIERLLRDIRDRKCLQDFDVHRRLTQGDRGAFTDALILQPNVAGVGIDLKAIWRFLVSGRPPQRTR